MKAVILPMALLLLAACAGPSPDTVSAMNFLQEPISATCARDALRDEEGFAVAATLARQGTGQRIEATFNNDLPVSGIIRNLKDGTSEVSFFARLGEDATPLDRREADFAVRQADEAVYRACTEDGQLNMDDGSVVIESEQ